MPVENLYLPARRRPVGLDHHLGGRGVLLDFLVKALARDKLAFGGAARALGERNVEVSELSLELRLSFARVVDVRGG